jgi:putative phosphoesterase
MKLCVFSDSHGCSEHMIAAVEREAPALCFFLGDGERDLAAVRERFPALPFFTVRGNCDLRSGASASLVCALGALRLFAAHGHLLNVKYEPGLDTLCAAAREARADAALFGHTHRPLLERRGELLLLNPGSIGRVAQPSYALLTLDGGAPEAELKTIK